MMQTSSFLLLAVTGGTIQLIAPQDDILSVYGYSVGFRVEVEQFSPVEDLDNGWRKVKVEKIIWVQK